MTPEPGKTYQIKDVNGIQAVAECLYSASYQPDRSDLMWVFAVALPHNGDDGRGVTLNAHESHISEID